MQITATVYPDTAAYKDVTWSVVKPGAGNASISSTGLLKALTNGIVYAKAVTLENPAKRDSILITISNQIPIDSIVISGGNSINTDNGTLTLTATVYPSTIADKSVTWSIVSQGDLNDTALISSAGVVTAVRNGKVTVRATSNADDSKYAEKVIVLINQIRLVSGISLGSNTSITTKKGSLQLTAVVSPTDAADKTVTWSIDNTAIATISSTGKLTALGTTDGTVVVTTTANDASKTKGTLTVTISNQHTNVNNSEVANNVYIYPNPAADAITIISGNTSFKCIKIFNVNGKLMNRLQNIAAGSKINVSKLPSGVYMVRLTDATKASVIKYFVKM